MQQLRMRQSPGPDNMMGAVKFMLPNRLGIYLHDTPDKSVFARDDRRLSSGCVRLEDAARLGRWLFNGNEPVSWGAPEDRADLPQPVPVYILYLTALPQDDRIVVQPDNYRRDAALS
jgi:murein L,D-transpeptidase YcbB/YkuD